MLDIIRQKLSSETCDEVMEIAWSTMWNVTGKVLFSVEVNLSFSFLSRISGNLIDYVYRQLTVSIVVSASAVSRLVDNLMPNHLQIVH